MQNHPENVSLRVVFILAHHFVGIDGPSVSILLERGILPDDGAYGAVDITV